MPKRTVTATVERASVWMLGLASVAYLALFAVNSLTRTRNFSPDSMNYVAVARNVSRGLGLTQPALGFNQSRWPVNAALPVPLTAQPPLYPLAVAALGGVLPSHADAALLVAALCYGGILFVGYRLATALYGQAAGRLSLPLLLLHQPLYYVAGFAWSEPLGILLVLLSLLMVVRAQRRGRHSTWMWLGAGLCAGLAFATRYLLLAAVVGAAPLLPGVRRRPASLLAYGAGLAPPVAAVVGRNLILSGSLMGNAANPSLVGMGANLEVTFWTVMGSFLGAAPPRLAAGVLVATVTLSLALLGFRHELGAWRSVGTWLPGIFAVAYLALLVGQRSLIHFDGIGPRLAAPATVALALLLAGLAARGLRVPRGPALAVAVAVTGLFVAREAAVLIQRPPVTDAARAAASPRLVWVAENTKAADLVIGDDTMDIPFYLDRPLVVSFSPYPYTDRPTYEHLAAFARARGYERAFLVLRDRYRSDADWRWAYGDFIADVVAGRTANYPGVIEIARPRDGHVFEWVLP